MRLVETLIEQATVEEARRLDKLLSYGEEDLACWKRKIDPEHFSTVRSLATMTVKEAVNLHAKLHYDTLLR